MNLTECYKCNKIISKNKLCCYSCMKEKLEMALENKTEGGKKWV